MNNTEKLASRLMKSDSLAAKEIRTVVSGVVYGEDRSKLQTAIAIASLGNQIGDPEMELIASREAAQYRPRSQVDILVEGIGSDDPKIQALYDTIDSLSSNLDLYYKTEGTDDFEHIQPISIESDIHDEY